MTVKELAYAAQRHIQASTGASFKRAHIYELLAAAFGFNSHAAFGIDSAFAELGPHDERSAVRTALIKRRCIDLEYPPDIAIPASSALESFLVAREIGAVSISSLIDRWGEDEYDEDGLEKERGGLFGPDEEGGIGPILLDGLNAAANKGNASAHYLLALIYEPRDADDLGVGSSYWYTQEQQGRVLTGVEKEWAEAYKARMTQTDRYRHHLREAGRLGSQEALLDLADRFDDPSFFEQSCRDVDADPLEVAGIAERMGRAADVKRWLIVAAESGDAGAMLRLIEEYDHDNPPQCWTWVYLSQLIGMDLIQDAYHAIHEDGSAYDDDVGGPLYVAGRGGVDLEPLNAEQDAIARQAAQRLFEQIEGTEE